MKKYLIAIFTVFALSRGVKADTIDGPLLVSTLINHVHTQTIVDFAGKTRLELTDAVIQAVPHNGSYLLEGQVGFSGTTTPAAGEVKGVDFVFSALFRVDPFLKGVVSFPPSWTFLSSIEHGPIVGYDMRERHSYFGYQFNLAFGLNPIKE